MEIQMISPYKNTIFEKRKRKSSQNPSKYHNSGTDPKFQHKPKYHLSKILISKLKYLYHFSNGLEGQNPLSY
jgi:hypothetical protein